MSSNTSPQSGQLNKYLHETHTVYDRIQIRASVSGPPPCNKAGSNGGNKTLSKEEEEEAVKALDKEMEQLTDKKVLKWARHRAND